MGTTTPTGLLHVHAANASSVQDQIATTVYYTAGFSHTWQSVTAGLTGNLTRIYMELASSSQGITGTLTVYEGTGTGGNVLASQSVVANDWKVDVTLNTPVPLTAGQVFTFAFTWSSAVSPVYGNYAAGTSNRTSPSGGGNDWQFVTYMATPAKSFIVQAGTANVAIGTDSIPAGRAINTGTGAYLSAGGQWTNSSDRNLKTAVEPVDPNVVLQKLLDVPISTWSYRADADVRHLGPMAQDFRAAFGLGRDDKHIGTVDGIGVTIAAIQGLHQKLEAREAELERASSRLTELENSLRAMRALVEQHEASRANREALEDK